MNDSSPYLSNLDKCEANYTPLTPVSLLNRTARTFPEYPAVIDGDVRKTWGEVAQRARKLASALIGLGVGGNQTVSVMAPNSLSILEFHFGVPMSGGVLNTINTRLGVTEIAYILNHARSRVFIVDSEFASPAAQALSMIDREITVIEVPVPGIGMSLDGALNYEEFLAAGDEHAEVRELPDDEWDAISLNYTSGTTGNPKGVVYHYRGAYLNALSNIVGWEMPHHSVYLWTLPMFHCNGWCFPWTLAAVAGVNVCLRQVSPKNIYDAIADHKVTHFCGAPVVMGMVINATQEERRPFRHKVNMMTAAAPPPSAVLEAMESEGFAVTHVYGLTETYGPAVMCAWKQEWDELDSQAKADRKSRQGVPYHVLEGLDIMNPDTMEPVEGNGQSLGEAMFRGNIVMKGYLDNPQATEAAFAGGWFHSGDLGVMHEDEYIQLKDRSKDIIISGGENISSIEVENCLYAHPDVLAAAVVACPDEKWGETPCAFVERAPGSGVSERELIDFCKSRIARYKAPKLVIFQELPKTSTGKIQKFKLREKAKSL
ncbi:MAG: acyl-CoA synthetase [Gammaproteobacteria bacterium]|nr:acyl-CoA synthetase [Gammaproteobacteria bacterium]MYD76589.1 acyl-CoA synthetase [Gammaproteobacteria bacterium]MYJ51783.1 acyl-CoA synthetase [Gammaproteobacteria bacterium]